MSRLFPLHIMSRLFPLHIMSRLFLILLGTFLTGVWAQAVSPKQHVMTRNTNQADNRLPTSVRPRHYDLQLQLHIYGTEPSDFFFQGQVSILLDCLQETEEIVLHMDSLDISDSDISVRQVNSPEELFSISVPDLQYQFLRLHLKKPLKTGNTYVLEFRHFSGPLRDGSKGLFLSEYEDGGNTVYLVISRMGPVYARKVFPCFDEPQLKATFNVSLVRRKATSRNYTSLFNTALVDSTDKQDEQGVMWTVDRFHVTPVMSTYRLTFVLSDFTCLQDTTASDPRITYRTYARPNAIAEAEKAHGLGLQVLDWFNQRFRPNYGQALSKLDNIALPVSNSEGNWGLITHREVILYQRGVTSAYYELWMISLVPHQIAHMWFGNYVNAKWWTSVWLDEALAKWWSLYAIEQVNPGWQMTEDWIALYLYSTLEKDSHVTSKPLNAEVDSPTKIADTIKDQKGTAIIRMIHFIMGTDTFVDGLNLYLKNNQYGNTDTSDLFSALDQKMQEQGFGGDYISAKMNPWVSQMGYPVVMVERTADGFRLTQKRFLVGSEEDADMSYQWDIPIVYATSEDPNMTKSRDDIRWLRKDSYLDIPVTMSDTWILINLHQVAYCRVLYDVDTWLALIDQLNRDPSVIPAINRGQIINDAWSLARAGMLNTSVALSTLDFLQKDTDLAPWKAFDKDIDHMALMLARTDIFPQFQAKIRSLLVTPLQTLTLNISPDMPPVDASVRTLIAEHACTYGVEECVNDARRLFTAWRTTGKNEINANLRFQYYCTAVAEGNATDWDFAYNTFMSSNDPQERKRLRRAMSCSRNQTSLQRLLEMTLNSNKIPSKDQSSTIYDVSVNPVGGELAYQFYVDHLDSLKSVVLSYVTSFFNTEADLNKLLNLIKADNAAAIRSEVQKAIDKTRINMAWMGDYYGLIWNWLISK